ncbi:muscle M-line assembly protein unc-89-like [Cocos nucifera]|uniref:Muscle M-line assembly protein unc-89-like n=1 Tax=Cocos nucifera TaxID=13894 RepID=A0A8K0MV57_COCNU|nr:muscle M-line assembly protein unc-89-like [Cocos nucifera]
MPETRNRAVRGGGAAAGEIAGGFFIRRGALPVTEAGPVRVPSRGLAHGKENIPRWAVTRRKSPLPAWHPRTPLRDITVIVNALQRRRSRLRPARAQQNAQRRDVDAVATTQPTMPTNPLLHEPSASEQTPHEPSASEQTPVNQYLPSDISDSSSIPTVTSFTSASPIEHPLQASSSSSSLSPAEHSRQTISVSSNLAPDDSKPTEDERKPSCSIEYPLQTCSSSSSLSPAENPPQTILVSTYLAPDDLKPTEYVKKLSSSINGPVQTSSSPSSLSSAELPHQTVSVSTIQAPYNSNPTEYEKKLSSSIDEIERAVKKNLERTTKVPARKAAQKRTLMSLR